MKRPFSDVPKRVNSRTRNYYDVQESDGESALARALSDCSMEQREIRLQNPERYRKDLEERGITPIVVDRLCILSRINGYCELTERPRRLSQPALENFLCEAFEKSGLQRAVILGLVGDITQTLETAYRIDPVRASDALRAEIQRQESNAEAYSPAFIVPASYYVKELDDIHSQFEQWHAHGKEIPADTLKMLQALCALGLPEAQYYLGFYRLRTPGKFTQDYAVKLLKKAAQSGNSDAAAALGDYYYDDGKPDKWGEALAYYMDYGASALNRKQRQAALSILNRKKTQKHTFRGGVVWSAMTVLWALIAAVLMPTIPEKIAGSVYAACNGLICFRFHSFMKKQPYGDAMNLFVCLLIALIAYLLFLNLLSLFFT